MSPQFQVAMQAGAVILQIKNELLAATTAICHMDPSSWLLKLSGNAVYPSGCDCKAT